MVACAFLDGRVDEASFGRARIASPDVHAFQQRVRVVRDERLRYNPVGLVARMRPTVIQVRTTDGRTLERSTMSPKGSPFNPLSEDELRRKFHAWAGPSLGPEASGHVLETVSQLEAVPDVAGLVAHLQGPAAAPEAG